MAWKRNSKGFFTPAQHQKMVKLASSGWTSTEIAKAAGCSPISVRRILRLHLVIATKVRKKEKKNLVMQDSPYDPSVRTAKEENSYLRWVISGIINHTGDNSYVDLLIKDFSEGKFIP